MSAQKLGSTKVVSELECPTGHGVIILSREYPEEYPRLKDQHSELQNELLEPVLDLSLANLMQ